MAEFKTNCTQLQQENERLEAALKEVMEALNGPVNTDHGEKDTESPVRFPAIERMLAVSFLFFSFTFLLFYLF